MKDFTDYTIQIKKESQMIPDSQLIFWGTWFCEKLLARDKTKIIKYFQDEEDFNIENIFVFLKTLIDTNNLNREKYYEYSDIIKNFDETFLDQTDVFEITIYEIIVSLDLIFNYIETNNRGWEYNISQSAVNVIDVILDDLGYNILDNSGFKHILFQKEINNQFGMIRFLRTNSKINSNDFLLF